MTKTHTFRLPHLTHKHSGELDHVIEDNMKLSGELKCEVLQMKIDKLAQQESLSKAEVKELHSELWEAYQQMIRWIAVCTLLGIEIGTVKYVQAILNRLWELLKTNPCTDKLPLTPEAIATYKQEVNKGFKPKKEVYSCVVGADLTS